MHEDKKKEEEIPPTEDLMREHGILNRALLIYEEVIRRIERDDFPALALTQTVDIVQSFIENYHENLEEVYIFPLFERAKKNVTLTKTLRAQHAKGREITTELKELASSKNTADQKIRNNVTRLLKSYIKMYRPHEAREDTELFPQVRSLISEKEFKELGEKFEGIEHKLFGEEGFRGIVHQIESIEKELGIYDLSKFTPS